MTDQLSSLESPAQHHPVIDATSDRPAPALGPAADLWVALQAVQRAILTLEPQKSLQHLVGSASHLTGAAIVAIVVPDGTALRVAACTPHPQLTEGLVLDSRHSLAVDALRSQTPHYIADLTVEHESDSWQLLDPASRTALIVPSLSEGKVISLLIAEAPQPHALSQAARELLALLALQAAGVLHQARLNSTLRTSEKEMRALISAMTDVIMVLDAAGHFLKFPPVQRTWLKAADELLGRRIAEVTSPEAAAFVHLALSEVLSTQQPVEVEFPLLIQSETIWVAAQLSPLSYQTVMCVARDVTARRRAERTEHDQQVFAEALRDSAEALNGTLELDQVLSRILDNIERVVPYDGASLMLVDNTRREATIVRAHSAQKDTSQFARPLSYDDLPYLHQIITQGRPVLSANTQRDPQWLNLPSTQWIRSYIGVPIAQKGRVVGVLNVESKLPGFYTATHAERLQVFAQQAALALENAELYASIRQHAELLEDRVAERTRELWESNERLKEVDRLKDGFVSRISHELRTPLTAIKLCVEMLEYGKPEKRSKYLATMGRETDRLYKLIEDLLDLSRVDLSSAEIRLSAVNTLVDEFVADRALTAGQHQLALTSELDRSLAPARTDRILLTEVLSNLITNALNYTPAGGQVIVTTSAQPNQHSLWPTITVQDSGPGISARDWPHLFERFYRGEAARDYKIPGVGLGLALSKQIMDKLGGKITVVSQAGHGAAFTVWLPPA